MSVQPEITFFTQVPDLLVERYGATVAMVYSRIRRYALRGACTARISTIAKNLSYNERTVRRSLEVLEAGGYLRVARTEGRRHVITLTERLQFAEPPDGGSVEVDGVAPDTMSAPTPDTMSAARSNPGHDVRATSDMVSAPPRTSGPTTPDTMSAPLKRQGKREEQETSQETPESSGASAGARAGGSAERPAKVAKAPKKPRERNELWDVFCEIWSLPDSGGRHRGLAGEFAARAKSNGASVEEVRAYAEHLIAKGELGTKVRVYHFSDSFLAWRKTGARRNAAAPAHTSDADRTAKYAGWLR